MQGPLMNWLKVNFSQVFSAWLHLKALRVFSESILRSVSQSLLEKYISLLAVIIIICYYFDFRYGLDSHCVSLVLKPHRRSAKSVHQALNDKYYHLDSMPIKGSKGDDVSQYYILLILVRHKLYCNVTQDWLLY